MTANRQYSFEAKSALQQLLREYYEALAAEAALNQLGTAEVYAPYANEIRERSKAFAPETFPNGIQNAEEAGRVLRGSFVVDNQVRFRKIGLLSQIDLGALPQNRVVFPAFSWDFIRTELFASGQDDVFYDTGVGPLNIDGIENSGYDLAWTVLAGSGIARSRIGVDHPFKKEGFIGAHIIKYLVDKARVYNRQSGASDNNPYINAASNIIGFLRGYFAGTPENTNPETISYFTNLDTKVTSLQGGSIDYGDPSVINIVEGWLPWSLLVYREAFDSGVSRQNLTDQRPNQPQMKALDIYSLGSGLVEMDVAIKALAQQELSDAFLSPENEQKRIDAKIDLYVRFLGGQRIDDGEATGTARDLKEALKDEKVKEAVLKADRDVKPFDLQCHLMQNITKLETLRRTDPRFQPRYRHINPVVTNGKPAEVLNTIQHGGALHNEGIKQFINICPDVYGLLEPYIQIWRQEFNDDGKIKMKGGKAIEKRLHIDSFLNPADLDSRLKKTGRTPGAGIKSFSWSLKGVQPAEVDNNITANLVMHFQTINDFFNGASKAGNDDPNFLDLIINSPAVRKVREGMSKAPANSEKLSKCNLIRDHLHEQYKGVNYRIRVNAGWSVPPSLMPSAEIPKPLRQAIEQTQVSLYLQQVRHNLDFKQNGSLELSIDYVASIAGLLTSKSADIFAPQSSNQIEEEMKGIDQALEDIKVSTTDKTLTDPQRVRKKELLEQKRQARQEDKLIKYRKLLCGLFQEQNSRIYNLTVNALDLLRPPISELDEYQRAARAKRFKKEPVAVYFADEINFSLLDSVNTTLTGNGLKKEEGEQPPSTEQAARIFSDAEQSRFQDIKKDPGSFRFIPFFYLGDLIDSVLQQIKNNNQGSPLNFKMFLSETEMIDPNIALQIGDLEDVIKCGEAKDLDWLVRLVESDPQSYSDIAGLSNIMNIGDIPISLDAFQVWFKDNVIKKDRGSYFFLHFIKDICADLVTKAMGSQCFGTNINFQQRFDAQPLLIKNTSAVSAGKVVRSSTLGNLHKAVVPALDSNQTIGGFILVSTDSKPSDLTGDYQKDLSRGIYHHFIGASCGILKNMTFNREDQEYLREAKIQKFGALGAEQLRELYSARLDLVGNNLYKNGMYIYINPTLLGATEEELSYLGLHGYYLVTGVESKITPSGFTTNLTALHEGMRFERAQLPDVSLLTGVIAEASSPTANPMPKKEPEAQVTIPLTDIVVSESVAEVTGINVIPFGAGK